MLHIPAREVTLAKRKVYDVQMKRFIRAVLVKFKSEPRSTLEERRVAMYAVSASLSGFPDWSEQVPIVEDEIFEEEAPWDLGDLTPRCELASSVLERIQALCGNRGLSIPNDVQALQVLRKDTSSALGSSCDAFESLVE